MSFDYMNGQSDYDMINIKQRPHLGPDQQRTTSQVRRAAQHPGNGEPFRGTFSEKLQ
jgi:hypothetical protein